MLTCEWMVLCEQVIRDAESGALTLMNCLEAVQAPAFPAHHPRFAFAATYRWVGAPPAEPHRLKHRLVRMSASDSEDVVVELEGDWAAFTSRGRVYVNFQVLRLVEPGPLRFRLDHALDEAEWVRGREAVIDVTQVEIDPQARSALRAELTRLGMDVPDYLIE